MEILPKASTLKAITRLAITGFHPLFGGQLACFADDGRQVALVQPRATEPVDLDKPQSRIRFANIEHEDRIRPPAHFGEHGFGELFHTGGTSRLDTLGPIDRNRSHSRHLSTTFRRS